jgi:hypothetical protein
MSWVQRWKSKYVTITPKNPSGLGVCDRSGFTFNHKDLVKQMEWRGNNLVWTGLMVGPPFIDVPSQQNRPPIVKNDPKTLKNPRLPKDYISPEGNPVAAPNVLLNKLNNLNWNE